LYDAISGWSSGFALALAVEPVTFRVQGFKGSGVQGFRGSGVQGFRGSGVQEFRRFTQFNL